jgi:hypothetical protein
MEIDAHDHREKSSVTATHGGQHPATRRIQQASTAAASEQRRGPLAQFQQSLDEIEKALIALRQARLRELAAARRQRAGP